MKHILVSPTEPKSLARALGKTSSRPEKHGVDFLWMTNKKWYGVQRKKYPEDLESSLTDGRLAKEMGQIGSIDQAFLVLEGYGQWTLTGEPMGQYNRLTLEAMFGLLTSVAVLYNMPTYRVRDQSETITLIYALKRWTESPDHQIGRSSLDRRPTQPKNKWGVRESAAWASHFLQGFEGVGPVQAKAILETFKGLPLKWDLKDAKELEQVAGIGKKTAEKLWRALQ